MARIEGTQNIPSELKELYDGTLTPLMPNAVVRGRYPWKMPAMQEGGVGVSEDQKKQRARWLKIRDKFDVLPQGERERWFASRPVWQSLMWYYNYFMMSGLLGNAVIGNKGAGVIKDINHYAFMMYSGAMPEATITVDECDPKKSVPFFFGAGIKEAFAGYPVAVYPYLKSLNSTQMIVKMSDDIGYDTGLSVTLIEYI